MLKLYKKVIFFLISFIFISDAATSLPEITREKITSLENITDNKKKVSVLRNISWELINSHPDSALKFAKKGYKISVKNNLSYYSAIHLRIIGFYYRYNGNFQKAIQFFRKSSNKFKEIGKASGQALCISDIAIIYANLGKKDSIYSYINNIKGLISKAKMNKHTGLTFMNLGNVYSKLNKPDSSFKYLKKARIVFKKIDEYENFRGYLYWSIGKYYMDKDEYTKAQKELKKAHKYFSSITISTLGIGPNSNILYLLAKIDKMNNNYKQSIKKADSALYIARKANLKTILQRILKLRSELSAETGDYKKAYDYYKQYVKEKDKLDKSLKKLELSLLQKQNQIKKNKNALLEKENQINKIKLENQQKLKKYTITFIVFLVILLGVLSYFFIINRRNNKILKEKNKELENINEHLDKFIYSASHDLKSPLNSVSGLVEIAKKENNPQQVYAYLDMINKGVEKLKTLIGDIVSLARNTSNKLEIKEVDLNSFFKELLEEYKYQEEAADIEIKLQIKQPVKFYIDPGRLYIIFSNLLSNAIRYTDPDKDEKIIDIDGEVNNEYALIKIWDNGIGINEEDKEKIFDMFYRVKDDKDGSGLGLYILKDTVDTLDGEVNVDSEKGKFTSFQIKIPNYTQ